MLLKRSYFDKNKKIIPRVLVHGIQVRLVHGKRAPLVARDLVLTYSDVITVFDGLPHVRVVGMSEFTTVGAARFFLSFNKLSLVELHIPTVFILAQLIVI